MVRNITDARNPDQSALGPRMRVIGAGLSRSATSSLQAALESPALGFSPCMHMAHIAPHASREQLVIDAMREDDAHKRRKLLHKIYDGYLATTDFPGWWFVDDLMDMYPDAQIVLNQRKGGGVPWKKSLVDSVGFFWSWQYLAICFLYKTDRLHWKIHAVGAQRMKQKFGASFGPDSSAEFYDVYQAFVLREAKKRGREVLIWKAEDGWGPLCKFLGKEEPKGEPFPWVNDAATMRFLKRILILRGLLTWAALIGVGYGAWKFRPSLVGNMSRLVACLKQGAALG